jgi:hypothetical protein
VNPLLRQFFSLRVEGKLGQGALAHLKSFVENLFALLPFLFYGCQEYVHLIANRVSRTCGGFAGAMLANCVPTLSMM